MAHVLVVDDDPVVYKIVRDQLEFDGHRTYPATDWSTMNEVLFSRPVSVVLMDVRLPGLDGDTLTEIIKKNLDNHPEVILHSSLEEDVLEEMATKVGAFAALTKGTPLARMRRVIGEAARAYEARTGKKAETGGGGGRVHRRA